MSAKLTPPNTATMASWTARSTVPTYNPLVNDEPVANVAYPMTASRTPRPPGVTDR